MTAITITLAGTPVAKGRGPHNRKATDQAVLDAYTRTGNVWRAAEELGMCGQTVHARLQKLGAAKTMRVFTAAEDAVLVERYADHANAGTVAELAAELGRTRHFLCRQARRLGLTDIRRKRAYIGQPTSVRFKAWHATHEHPRGMLGKTHSDAMRWKAAKATGERWAMKTPKERREAILKSLRTRVANGTHVPPRPNATWKSAWREIGGQRCYFRSSWEANYARYLEWLKNKGQIAAWAHEPCTFWFERIKRGCVSYLPDFLVTEVGGAESYHEVKGWMDARSKTKIRRMKKYHPAVRLVVIDAKAYRKLAAQVRPMIAGWE